ncbi:universal stress protein [Pseudooceanicola sp. CBS1P-1]|uniref:Universal stress protein n=1 Tax=Pseudooceanicola albus TaxID=2692189 RepID=A0A6L7G1D4_9RHOB|nr:MULTISPECIES: universal stress protein [Pseudooceanicola]MBT9383658.1 universal stress protein [Pseudooceanicola endophyticus]MXN17512.1 universal stress protein [Pseudooceanicola albus]
MFSKIMVPVDLTHAARLTRALDCASQLGQSFGAELVYVGVTTALPGPIAHNPAEYAEKLKAFAAEQGAASGLKTSAHAVFDHDTAIDIDHALLRAVEETGCDLVVMASHIPNLTDYIWPSNGGRVASHAKVSVLVVRGM